MGGLVFPSGGWAHPPALCRALARDPRIAVRTGTPISTLERGAERWSVWTEGHLVAESAVVVLACGLESARYVQTRHLPLRVNRGQITLLPATAASRRLSAVLCGESYVAPARSGVHTAGATFARECSIEVTASDNAENLAMLAKLSPELFSTLGGARLDAQSLAGRAALRCVSPDYLPLVGKVTEGLYISAGHGSRGLITAPLAGEVLAGHLEGEPLPLPDTLVQAISPARFARADH
jgi:tRNA 5-methylaminomethyl-2-thiouridine biosynthesis bifunctional protein